MACPAPFLAPGDFPPNEGYVPGRFCGTITSDLACCLPCPTQDWIYSDSFERNIKIGTWFNIPSLVCQVFLLVTFAIWPKAISHRHYLSIGLCISLILLHLAFIIPLGTKPSICANELTPKDMYSSQSCAWSGALIEAGAMGVSVWVLLRSLWVHLQVCWDIDILKKRAGFWAAQAIGWGLPGLFLAVSFPISGVSYRVGPTCFPNTYRSFITWFGWLIAFGCLATAIQFATTIFCLWIYLRDIVRGGESTTTANSTEKGSRNSTYTEEPAMQSQFEADDSARGKLAWDRVKKVAKSQWRSMVLCIGLSVFSIYFGAIFVSQARTGAKAASGESRDALVTWAFCLITNNGDKSQCGGVGKSIGLNENMVVAIWPLAGLLGLLTFLLMLRGSMLGGWWRLIRYQRRHPRIAENHNVRRVRGEKPAGHDNFLPRDTNTMKRRSYGMRLETERPGMVSPTDSEHAGAPASPVSPIFPPQWPIRSPQQTSSQHTSAYGRSTQPVGQAHTVGYASTSGPTQVRQVPMDGFDSSSDDDEDVVPAHGRRNSHHMV